jgi:hypothetical protein
VVLLASLPLLLVIRAVGTAIDRKATPCDGPPAGRRANRLATPPDRQTASAVMKRAVLEFVVGRSDAGLSMVLVALETHRGGGSGERRRVPVTSADRARHLLCRRLGLLCGAALLRFSLCNRVSSSHLQRPMADRWRLAGRSRAASSALNVCEYLSGCSPDRAAPSAADTRSERSAIAASTAHRRSQPARPFAERSPDRSRSTGL